MLAAARRSAITTPPQSVRSPAPTRAGERIVALDVLRGFALMGILLMNIQFFAMPMAAYFNPSAYGDLQGANYGVWALSHVFADQKFMTIFSILFGAGVVLFTTRVEGRGRSALGLHYRRSFWLLVIGLCHAYLLWAGDILVAYALCAFLVYWFRKVRPSRQLAIGLLLIAVPSLIMLAGYVSIEQWPEEAVADFMADWRPSEAQIDAELAAYRGGWLSQMDMRVPQSLEMQTFAFFFWSLWRASGLMLVGMALFTWGVLTAERSTRFYARLAAIGLLLGIPLVAYGVLRNTAGGWELAYSRFGPGFQLNYWGSLLISSAYIALVMLFCLWGGLPRLRLALAAVGRTALTNYLLQTILATAVFYGSGLGLFGSVERTGQLLIVLLIWAAQLVISPLWLRYFRYGPFEWLWRSLTYWRPQPMRVAASGSTRATGGGAGAG